MRHALHVVLVMVTVLTSRFALSLVDPAISALTQQPWFAQIYVSDGVSAPKEFCKGALINSQWILTSGFCVYDPFEALGTDRDATGKTYVVKFAGSAVFHEIERFVQSPDLAAGMMKLVNPVTIQPVRLSTRSEADLRSKDVFILGTESTAATGDIYYNPDLGKRMYCRVDGQVFFRTGALCYLMPKLVKASGLLEARAKVIDPGAPGAPNSSVDTYAPFDTTGNRLYLDFRATSSYPCNEDLGAPVLYTNEAGTIEVVGIVSGVGMALFPLCNPSLANVFGTLSAYQDFIDTTMAQDAFDSLCPSLPEVNVEYTGDRGVRVWWNPVAGATGYRLLYTIAVGYIPFVTLDVGNQTEVRTEISPVPIYHVALVAYNEACTSPISPELAVAL
ncbi:MAG: trypsin-like serine protease [Burkholderiales bacterium]